LPSLLVEGSEVWVEGESGPVILMLHGWPDTHRLWDSSVAALEDRYRCVRFTLPGFTNDIQGKAQAIALDAMVAHIAAVANAVSPDQPVTLLLHDWGCIFGYEFAARHPERVARVVGVDIGDHNSGAYLRSLSASAKLQIVFYQVWLALAWQAGRWVSAGLATRMTRWMARAMRCPTPADTIAWSMNFPYAMAWMGVAGGLRHTAPVRLPCPTLYIYGERKPFLFHSPEWLAELAARPDAQVRGFPCGHWVMVERPADFTLCVKDWLETTD
jgi:pimeloyl-ACP methyl ester carboxylesterase